MKETRTATTTASAQGTWNGIERRRVEKVVEALAVLRSRGDNLAEVAHDARNMVTALTIYCDLLEAPGVLGSSYAHYAQELRLVAAASRRLVDKLLALDACAMPGPLASDLLRSKSARKTTSANHLDAGAAGTMTTPRLISLPSASGVGTSPLQSSGLAVRAGRACADRDVEEETERDERQIVDRCEDAGCPRFSDRAGDRIGNPGGDWSRRGDLLPSLPVANLAAELAANGNLLAALAGPSIALTIDTDGGAQAVRLTAEDLTRLLVNLVKNAAEAMPKGGKIDLILREVGTAPGTAPCLALSITDSGPGIPEEALEKIFVSGYSSKGRAAGTGLLPQIHRGLGLVIVRSIVEGAGGRVTAANGPQGGACFTLELPVRNAGTGDCGMRVRGIGNGGRSQP